MTFRLFLVAATAAAALSAPVAHADVATNLGSVFKVFLYYAEDGQIVRTQCPDQAISHDHATCAQDPHRVKTNDLIPAVEAEVGAKNAPLTQQKADYYVRINQVDQRLLALLSATPAPNKPELLAQIHDKEDAFAANAAVLADLRDQIARIRAELAHAEDPALRDQLVALLAKASAADSANTDLGAQVVELRSEYIDANSQLLDQATYDDLENERSELVEGLRGVEIDLTAVLADLTETARLMKEMLDPTFTTDRLSQSSSAVQQAGAYALQAIYTKLDLAARTATGTSPDRRRIVLATAWATPIETFRCTVQFAPGIVCEALSVTSDHGYAGVGAWWDFEIRRADQYVYPATLSGLLALSSAQGTWTVAPSCPNLPDSGPLLASFECAMVVGAN